MTISFSVISAIAIWCGSGRTYSAHRECRATLLNCYVSENKGKLTYADRISEACLLKEVK